MGAAFSSTGEHGFGVEALKKNTALLQQLRDEIEALVSTHPAEAAAVFTRPVEWQTNIRASALNPDHYSISG